MLLFDQDDFWHEATQIDELENLKVVTLRVDDQEVDAANLVTLDQFGETNARHPFLDDVVCKVRQIVLVLQQHIPAERGEEMQPWRPVLDFRADAIERQVFGWAD